MRSVGSRLHEQASVDDGFDDRDEFKTRRGDHAYDLQDDLENIGRSDILDDIVDVCLDYSGRCFSPRG